MEVVLSKQVAKGLKKLPKNVKTKLHLWISSVETIGLEDTRKIKGYHDEPLTGSKKGRRSIRLNRSWRAEYRGEKDKEGKFGLILEVHHHEY